MDNLNFTSVKEIKKAARALKEFVRDITGRRLFELSIEAGAVYGYDQSEDLLNLSRLIDPNLRNEPKCWGSIPNVPQDVGEDLFRVLLDTRDAFLTIGLFLGAQAADTSGRTLDRLGDAWVRSVLRRGYHWNLPGNKEGKKLTDEYMKGIQDLLHREPSPTGPTGKIEDNARAQKGGRHSGADKKRKSKQLPDSIPVVQGAPR